MKRLAVTVPGKLASVLDAYKISEILDDALESIEDTELTIGRIRQPISLSVTVTNEQYQKLREIAVDAKTDVTTVLKYCLIAYSSLNKLADESVWRDKLHKELGGTIEVKTKSGRIDLLTSTQIIEVKIFDRWKSALGQVLAYHFDYNLAYKPVIALFGNCPETYKPQISNVCGHYGVDVLYLD